MIVITRTRIRSRRTLRVDNSPTPEKIRSMTEQIRKGWTPRERSRRANSSERLEIPQMPLQTRRKGFWGD